MNDEDAVWCLAYFLCRLALLHRSGSHDDPNASAHRVADDVVRAARERGALPAAPRGRKGAA